MSHVNYVEVVYEQWEGVAMGLLVFAVVANLYIEFLNAVTCCIVKTTLQRHS